MTTELFGQCYFAGAPAKDSLPLSDEVIAAGRAYMASTGITRPPRVQRHESAYWGNMSEGTGLSYNVDANGAQRRMEWPSNLQPVWGYASMPGCLTTP